MKKGEIREEFERSLKYDYEKYFTESGFDASYLQGSLLQLKASLFLHGATVVSIYLGEERGFACFDLNSYRELTTAITILENPNYYPLDKEIYIIDSNKNFIAFTRSNLPVLRTALEFVFRANQLIKHSFNAMIDIIDKNAEEETYKIHLSLEELLKLLDEYIDCIDEIATNVVSLSIVENTKIDLERIMKGEFVN